MANPEMWTGEHLKQPKPDQPRGGRGLKRTGIKAASKRALAAKSAKAEARDNGWLRCLVYCKLLTQEPPYRCEKCGRPVSEDLLEAVQILEPCHIIPRRKGTAITFHASGEVRNFGGDTWDNIYAGCDECNLDDHLRDRDEPAWTKGRETA